MKDQPCICVTDLPSDEWCQSCQDNNGAAWLALQLEEEETKKDREFEERMISGAV